MPPVVPPVTPPVTIPSAPSSTVGASGTSANDLSSISQSVTANIAQLREMIDNPKAPPDVMGMYLAGLQSIMQQLDKREKELRDASLKDQTEVDPGTQLVLDEMRENLKENLKQTAESLNARGLFHSGILLEMETKIRKGSLTAEAKVMADRLSGIKRELNEGLTNIGNQRFGAASNFTLGGLQGQQQANESSEDRRQNLISLLSQQQLGLRGQMSGEAQARASLDEQIRQFNSSSAAYQARAEATLNEQIRQFNENFGREKAAFNIEQTERERTNRASEEIARRNAGQSAATAARPSAGAETAQRATANWVSFVQQMASSGMTREDIMADFQQNIGLAIDQGANVAAVIEAINTQLAQVGGGGGGGSNLR